MASGLFMFLSFLFYVPICTLHSWCSLVNNIFSLPIKKKSYIMVDFIFFFGNLGVSILFNYVISYHGFYYLIQFTPCTILPPPIFQLIGLIICDRDTQYNQCKQLVTSVTFSHIFIVLVHICVLYGSYLHQFLLVSININIVFHLVYKSLCCSTVSLNVQEDLWCQLMLRYSIGLFTGIFITF